MVFYSLHRVNFIPSHINEWMNFAIIRSLCTICEILYVTVFIFMNCIEIIKSVRYHNLALKSLVLFIKIYYKFLILFIKIFYKHILCSLPSSRKICLTTSENETMHGIGILQIQFFPCRYTLMISQIYK